MASHLDAKDKTSREGLILGESLNQPWQRDIRGAIHDAFAALVAVFISLWVYLNPKDFTGVRPDSYYYESISRINL